MNFIDVATGSLGQGLGFACGMAYAGKYFDQSDYRVYCVLGDGKKIVVSNINTTEKFLNTKTKSCVLLGECSEGSVWESFAFGSYYKLDNLCAIIDVNRLGQSDPAPLQHDMETYRKRVEAFG